MKKKLLYSALYMDDCFPFQGLAEDVDVASEPSDLKQLDSMLIVWGGADIHPSYYGHEENRRTHAGAPARDKREWALMNAAVESGIPIIGVCRGAQMLCALAGGWLIQDVQNHVGNHFCRTFDNKILNVNSLHHQMMAGLEDVEHELVVWNDSTHVRNGRPYHIKKDEIYDPNGIDFKEPEMVYFPKLRSYAVQWHPEMMPAIHPATEYMLNYITKKETERARSESQVTV